MGADLRGAPARCRARALFLDLMQGAQRRALCRRNVALRRRLMRSFSLLVSLVVSGFSPLHPFLAGSPSAAQLFAAALARPGDVGRVPEADAQPVSSPAPVSSCARRPLSEPDSVQAFPLHRLAFGSCYMTHEQRKTLLSPLSSLFLSEDRRVAAEEEIRRELRAMENQVWDRVKEQDPTAWIWMGDAGYSRAHDVASVREALDQVKRVPAYEAFRRSVPFLDGTWDDHDYGMNDGGKYQKNREALREAFLDFVDVPPHSPRRRGRQGVYSSHVFGVPVTTGSASDHAPLRQTEQQTGESDARNEETEAGAREHTTEREDAWREAEENDSTAATETQRDGRPRARATNPRFVEGTEVKLILLDTRHERDNHFIPSAGMIANSSLFSLVAATTRTLCHLFALGGSYDGDLLGEAQWQWLEKQLTNSTASVHILVSSIQVTTTLPLVESWGHFPRARERLFSLLRRSRPAGLVLLSGDVHFGEISGDNTNVLEVTSSGMTHTAGDSFWKRFLIERALLPYYSKHRREPSDVFVQRNFGVINFRYLNERGEEIPSSADILRGKGPVVSIDLEVRIVDASSGAVALATRQRFPSSPSTARAHLKDGEAQVRDFALSRHGLSAGVFQDFSVLETQTPALVADPASWWEMVVAWMVWPAVLLACPLMLCGFIVSFTVRRQAPCSKPDQPGPAGQQADTSTPTCLVQHGVRQGGWDGSREKKRRTLATELHGSGEAELAHSEL